MILLKFDENLIFEIGAGIGTYASQLHQTIQVKEVDISQAAHIKIGMARKGNG